MIWKKQPVGSKLSDLQNNKASKDTATQSAAGLMSATDKTKLDGVATGATAVSVVNNLNSDSATSALSAAQGKALNSKSITVTNWNCQSNENWSANSWSHIGGGGIPSSAIPSGKTISANLIGIFAVSTESGWTRIVANLRTDAVNDIALSIYSNVAGNTNSIKFKALWL